MLTSSTQIASSACPSFFKALCWTASQGGSGSYEWAGYGLAGALSNLGPYQLEDDEWAEELDRLDSLIRDPDISDDDVVAWFDRWLPRCMALVPSRRRKSFLKGVYRNVTER
jgi:hypothetical protein